MSDHHIRSGLLRGRHVYFSLPTEADMSTMEAWYLDIEFMRYLQMGLPSLVSVRELREWMLKVEDSHGLPRYQNPPYTIRTLSDDRLVGVCAFKEMFWHMNACKLWIGIGNPDDRGRGFGTDSLRLMLRYAFLEMNMNRVGLEVSGFNERARQSYERIGFVHEGTLREFMYRDGKRWDMHMMAILRTEWEARYGEDPYSNE